MELKEYKIKAFRTIKFVPVGGNSDQKVIREKRDACKDPLKRAELHQQWLEWGRLNPSGLDFAHMLLGMSSELNELEDAIANKDVTNVGEELADIAWYTVGWCNFRNLDVVPQMDLAWYNYNHLVRTISKLHNLAKKEIIYGKIIDKGEETVLVQKLVEILYNFEWEYNKPKIYLPQHLSNNIDKLSLRYPDFFSDVRALDENRNLEAERKALENGKQ